MKPRNVTITIEVETDAPLATIRKEVGAMLAIEMELKNLYLRPLGRAHANVAESSKKKRK